MKEFLILTWYMAQMRCRMLVDTLKKKIKGE